MTKSIISLLSYYGWKKFSIIHEERWTTVANSLKEQARSKNMTINHCKKVVDYHKCCENNLTCCRSGYWHQVLFDIIGRERIATNLHYLCQLHLHFSHFNIFHIDMIFSITHLDTWRSWYKIHETELEFTYFSVQNYR